MCIRDSKKLLEIRDLIANDMTEFDRIKRFIENMCREDHFDDEAHQASLPSLEKAKRDGLAGAPHIRLSAKPSFLRPRCMPATLPSLWDQTPQAGTHAKDSVSACTVKGTQQAVTHAKGSVPACTAPNLSTAEEGERKLIQRDAVQYKEKFEDLWHHEKDGVRIPPAYCRKSGFKIGKMMKKKRAGCEEVCKQDFPKTRRLNLIPRVICPGVARTYKVNVKGRRNSLCLLLPRRRCAWFSGCSPSLAVWTGANTHIAPNYRIPLTKLTHDPECARNCLAKVSDRRLTTVAGLRACDLEFPGRRYLTFALDTLFVCSWSIDGPIIVDQQ